MGAEGARSGDAIRKTTGQRQGNSPFVLDIEPKTDLCTMTIVYAAFR